MIQILSKKHYPIFPLQILHENTIQIYERLQNEMFSKKSYNLPENVLQADIKDNVIVYCNNYEVGIINANNILEVSIVWKSFGNIIDFSIGMNTLIVDNYHNNLCKLYQIKKGIIID